jgi:hypothetical protein
MDTYLRFCRNCGGVASQLDGQANINATCHNYTGGVTMHNGRVLANPFVYPIFWGSAFSQRGATGALISHHACVDSLSDFLNALRSKWLSGLAQYGVHTLNFFPGQLDTIAPGTDPTGVTRADVRAELIRWITYAQVGVPLPDELQRCFLVFLPTTATMTGDEGACGYHENGYYAKTSGNRNLFYSVISTQGVSTALSGDDFINQISYCISHELAELFTNPDGRGWFADPDLAQGRTDTCEIGDICETKGTVKTLGKWTVEKYWSQTGSDCFDSTSPAPAPPGPPAPPVGGPPVGHPPQPPLPIGCQQLAVRLGQLETQIEQITREPPSPTSQAVLRQLEQELAAAQADYERQCVIHPPPRRTKSRAGSKRRTQIE